MRVLILTISALLSSSCSLFEPSYGETIADGGLHRGSFPITINLDGKEITCKNYFEHNCGVHLIGCDGEFFEYKCMVNVRVIN